MPSPPPGEGFLARAALGLWLCAIGVLGLLQFWLRAFGPEGFDPDLIAWLWLCGAVVVIAIGIAAVIRAARAPRGR